MFAINVYETELVYLGGKKTTFCVKLLRMHILSLLFRLIYTHLALQHSLHKEKEQQTVLLGMYSSNKRAVSC